MIQWVTKRRVRKNDCMAVAFHVYDNGKMHLTFFGDTCKKITERDYMQLGVDCEQNRIYFQGGTAVNGYKLHANGASMHLRSKNQFTENFISDIGVYDLLFDEEQKLYYIQLGKENQL